MSKAKEPTFLPNEIRTQNARPSSGKTAGRATPGEVSLAIMRAALAGQTDAVVTLLNSGNDVNARDSDGRTPLMEAAFGGHLDVVEALLERGADVNAKDKDGWTALMEATSKGLTGIVRSLLSGGADVNARNEDGLAALNVAAKKHPEITRLLKEAGAK